MGFRFSQMEETFLSSNKVLFVKRPNSSLIFPVYIFCVGNIRCNVKLIWNMALGRLEDLANFGIYSTAGNINLYMLTKCINSFVPNAAFLCPPKTLCFQGVKKGCIGNKLFNDAFKFGNMCLSNPLSLFLNMNRYLPC